MELVVWPALPWFTGDNDVTVIFKTKPGSRRWQHNESDDALRSVFVEHGYTVILGSHRNTCLKFERDGQLQDLVDMVRGALPQLFTSPPTAALVASQGALSAAVVWAASIACRPTLLQSVLGDWAGPWPPWCRDVGQVS
jgi:hypothetical protein